MTISISKFFKHELRSSRVAYHEHLQTGTTTARKEKCTSAEKQPNKGVKDCLNKRNQSANSSRSAKAKSQASARIISEGNKGSGLAQQLEWGDTVW